MSLLIASCGSANEPTSATTTVVQPDESQTDANRRAKSISATGTKTNNDLLRSVEPKDE